MITDNEIAKLKKTERRIKICKFFVLGIFLAIIVYLFLIQVADIKHYKAKAQAQRFSRNFIMRGEILDRNGIKLASDKISFNLYAHREYFDHSTQELAEKLSPIIDVPVDKIKKALDKGSVVTLIKKDIDRSTANKIKKLELRELSLDKKNERVYPQEALAAHVLGYYNPDADIAAGVEKTASDKLVTTEKNVEYEKTPTGDIIYDIETDPLQATTPVTGQTVELTIDSAIQHICETELNKVVGFRSAQRGAVIVMNPKNGEILAYAVFPSYNPNDYRKAKDVNIKNWTLTDVYPPGSTFKTLTVASALELGVVKPNSTVLDTGKMKIGSWTVTNYDYHKNPYPGKITLEYLLEHSSNVGSANLAFMMKPADFYRVLKNFGIGTKTGIDLPGESSGLLPNPKKWDISRHASMGYGYGASVTAMQMISAVSAIANNGVRVTPHVIKYSPEEAETKIKSVQVLRPEVAKAVTRILTNSTSRAKTAVNIPEYNVAAKTGTSRKPIEHGKGYGSGLYASTIGFLPSQDPKLLIYVVVDCPSASAGPVWGSTVAAPIFREVAMQSARILNIPPDKPAK